MSWHATIKQLGYRWDGTYVSRIPEIPQNCSYTSLHYPGQQTMNVLSLRDERFIPLGLYMRLVPSDATIDGARARRLNQRHDELARYHQTAWIQASANIRKTWSISDGVYGQS